MAEQITWKNLSFSLFFLLLTFNLSACGTNTKYGIAKINSTPTGAEIVNLKELPLSNLTHIAPISSQKVNDTLLEWARKPESNPYQYPADRIYGAGLED